MVMLFCLVLESLLDLEYLPLSEEQNVTTPPQRPSPITNSLILILTVTPPWFGRGRRPEPRCCVFKGNKFLYTPMN